MNPLERRRNVPPSGSRLLPVAKAGYREELHPRGYHGRFIGSTLKPRGGRHEVVAKGSGETIGHISKVDRRLNIRPVTRERYHVAVHRGQHVGNFDTRALAHAEISERERLHQGLGPSVEHGQLKEVNYQISQAKGNRTIANSNASRLQRQAYSSKLTPEGRAKAHADRAKHLDRAQQESRNLEDFHKEQKYLQNKLIQEGGKAKIKLDTGGPVGREHGKQETADRLLARQERESGAPTAHAHQVGTIVEMKQKDSLGAPLTTQRSFKVVESRPEGVKVQRQGDSAPIKRLYPHDEVTPVTTPRGWSNTEVAQHFRNTADAAGRPERNYHVSAEGPGGERLTSGVVAARGADEAQHKFQQHIDHYDQANIAAGEARRKVVRVVEHNGPANDVVGDKPRTPIGPTGHGPFPGGRGRKVSTQAQEARARHGHRGSGE